jgi:hypothetical protein
MLPFYEVNQRGAKERFILRIWYMYSSTENEKRLPCFNTKHLTAAALRDMGSGPGESAYDWVDIAG